MVMDPNAAGTTPPAVVPAPGDTTAAAAAAAAAALKKSQCLALVGTPSLSITGTPSVNISSGLGANSGNVSGTLAIATNNGITDSAKAASLLCLMNSQITVGVAGNVSATQKSNIVSGVALDGSLVSSAGKTDAEIAALGNRALAQFGMNAAKTAITASAETDGNKDPIRCVTGNVWVKISYSSTIENTKFDAAPQYFNVNLTNTCWGESSLNPSVTLDKGTNYGSSVAIDGTWAAAVSPKDDSGSLVNSGLTYIYSKGSSGWTLAGQISLPGAAAGDTNSAVALSGDYLAISSEYRKSVGGVFVYHRVGTTWVQFGGELSPTVAQSFQGFGRSLSLSGNMLVVGAPDYSVGGAAAADASGAVYVYVNNGAGFVPAGAPLTLGANQVGKGFGSSVSLDGTKLAVGAPQALTLESLAKGEVELYNMAAPAAPSLIKKITADSIVNGTTMVISNLGAKFGSAVALKGSVLVIGASGAVNGGKGPTGAFVYYANYAVDTHVSFLSGDAGAEFGTSVAVGTDGVFVGSPGFNQVTGAVDYFKFSDLNAAKASLAYRMFAYQSNANSGFGHSIGLSGSDIVVGARLKSLPNSGSGAAYIYSKK